MSKTRRAASLLLLFATFFIDQVVCRGGGGGFRIGGGGGGKLGDDVGDAVGNHISSLNLPPGQTAIFAITIVVAILTLLLLYRALVRLKKPVLPVGVPTLQYDVGKVFLWLLASYLFFYLISNILFAVIVANDSASTQIAVSVGIAGNFMAQVSDVLFLGMILAIIAHRQRIQLNPAEKPLNLKSFLDGWLLSIILILGIAADGLQSQVTLGPEAISNLIDIRNFYIAYQVFNFVASCNVIGTAIMAHTRLTKSGIQDNIVRLAAIWISPFVFIRALDLIINTALTTAIPSMGSSSTVDGIVLLIVGSIVGGVCAIAVAGICLSMGAPPIPPKDKNKDVNYSAVKA